MKGLANKCSVAALAALLIGLNACGGSYSGHKVIPPPPVQETGVVSVGVITGFGSVYVNGVRYDTSSASFLMDDQAGRAGLGVNHWIAYGIAPEANGLPEGAAVAAPAGFSAGKLEICL